MNLYGFGHGDRINYTDPFGLCVWDLCVAEGTAALWLAGGAAAALAAYSATHQGEIDAVGRRVDAAVADTATYAAMKWGDVKKGVARGLKAIGLIGGALVGGEAGKLSDRLLDIDQARVEAAKRKDDQEKARKDKDKEGSRGSGSGGSGSDQDM